MHALAGVAAALVTVSPATSLEDQPLSISVRGLPAHTRVVVALRSTDAAGVRWGAGATFLADGRGRIALDHAVATGLVASMRGPELGRSYAWIPGTPARFVVLVRVRGRLYAAGSFTRGLAAVTATTVGHGVFFAAPGASQRPAVLAFGGSEGGLNSSTLHEAELLAAHGYPTLALAYFGQPGLPRTLSAVPLEYFVDALHWLDARPEVDPAHVFVLGTSRGSEAALLLGAYFSDLVHGVIANVPSDVALCSYPGCAGPAWTLGGSALPYTRQFDTPQPSDDPNAVIPVERIAGPVFLDCGARDEVWISCDYLQAIVDRLRANNFPYRVSTFEAPTAGHFVGTLVPWWPGASQPDQYVYAANDRARAQLWPRLLSFLASS